MASDRPRLLFVVTEDWYFHSHRLPLAQAALDAGYAVAVATRVNAHRAAIEACGCEVIPLREAAPTQPESLARDRRRDRTRRRLPALASGHRPPGGHEARAVRVARRPSGGSALFVNALAGLGFVYSSRTSLARMLRPADQCRLAACAEPARLGGDRPER